MSRRCLAALGIVLAAGLAGPGAARAACSVDRQDFDQNGSQDVKILGDALPQNIIITGGGGSYRVQVDCNGNGVYTDSVDIDTGVQGGGIESYDIRGGGKDSITYQQFSGGSLGGLFRNLAVTFGPSTATQPNSLLVRVGTLATGTSLTVDVAGSPGPDFVQVRDGVLTDSSLVLNADLGAGDDRFVMLAMSATRSSVTGDVALGSGNNSIGVYSLGTFDASLLSMDVEGGSVGTQADALRFSGGPVANGGRTFVSANLLGGNDSAEVGFDNVVTGGAAHVRIVGGDGNDTLAAANETAAVVDGRLDVSLDAGAGSDVALFDSFGGGISGNGRLRVRLHGGDGNDTVAGTIAVDSSATTPHLDLGFSGGRNSDAVFPTVLDPSGLALWGPFGGVQTQGGYEKDLCLYYGDAPVDFTACDFTT